jgi:hypothetical protein
MVRFEEKKSNEVVARQEIEGEEREGWDSISMSQSSQSTQSISTQNTHLARNTALLKVLPASLVIMLSILASAALAGFFASPVVASPLGVSLPPLIPSIPGVTEPLASNAPPLPILQAPTPPIDSPPFTPSNIRPKKVGYIWTGSGNNQNKDFLVTLSLDDDTFGTIIQLTDVPTSGNSPHHLGPSVDGKTLVGGGLLSLLKTQDTAFYWDVQNPYRPAFKKSNRAILSSIVDEIRAKPEGGFFITYM